ncbi:uncharacterized protein LOC143300570 [Babylonia areolata]|uniref:uncharacterized protein LOC143300570 n=1 Tax=Babylonia areolata TaxID=304850 RepID=UPI003FD1F7C5
MDVMIPGCCPQVVSRVVVMTLLLVCTGSSGRRQRYPGAPAALRIRPPPMVADPISPDCYNFTVGNWPKQEFYSPNYPSEYINNTDCVLYLEAPPGFTIQLDFREQFTLEQSEDCKYDFLEVRDGPFAYSPLIDRFCGAMFPPLIDSTNRFLWLRFKTDDLLQYGGFRAIYSYHKDHTQDDGTSLSKVMSTVCRIPIKLGPDNPDGVLTSQEVPFGDVSDPNYPRNRPVDCTWEIFTDQGNTIHLQTVKMARGGGSNPARCDISYVAIYQATTLPADRKGRLCGDDDPQLDPQAVALTSHSNRVFVRLYGNALHHKPDLEMVYSLVRTGDACTEDHLSCGHFCIGQELRCNGVPNCPDARDERGCPADTGIKPRGRGKPGRGEGGDGGAAGGGGAGGGSAEDGDDDEGGAGEEGQIPLHMIILGAVGGVLATCVCLCLCIMCRSRRQHARKKREEEQKARDLSARQEHVEMSATPTSHTHHPHPTHSLSRPGDKDGGRMGVTKGQGQPQGRYMTFAHVNPATTPTPRDNPHRYSFTGQGTEGGGEMGEGGPDSGQYRRFLSLEMTPDPMDDPSSTPHLYSPQGGILGMTHLPSSPTPTPMLPGQPPVEGGGGGNYGVKYQNQWAKGMMMEDPNLVYPYTSSLPRPTPFLGLSKPFPTESKYLKSMQALKVMDEEIMKDSPPS